ncbi:hypothetical protein I79_001624 [Cricetulus griseus]|uniref:Uncharacterized protein n=1 Tax=Cricetulus griseus TaxID=10029 RepID=G3GV93_CRIGR|nr:hypothetical protein I79_001624 [Cricetulus griseus]
MVEKTPLCGEQIGRGCWLGTKELGSGGSQFLSVRSRTHIRHYKMALTSAARSSKQRWYPCAQCFSTA